MRNSVGMDFNPKDKSLWFTDNQVDGMGDDIPPGELNRADKPGMNFGFPYYGGGKTRTTEYKDQTPPADVTFPQVEMVAHAADLGMTFYSGKQFPAKYRGGIFSAQHGSWNRTVPIGARVMFTSLKEDGTADKTEPFAEGWLTITANISAARSMSRNCPTDRSWCRTISPARSIASGMTESNAVLHDLRCVPLPASGERSTAEGGRVRDLHLALPGEGGVLAALVLALSLATGAPAHAGDVKAGRQKALQCQTCHGLDGLSKLPEAPNLGGQPEPFLVNALNDFRKGLRKNDMMTIVVEKLSDQDVADLAAYFAAIEVSTKPPK